MEEYLEDPEEELRKVREQEIIKLAKQNNIPIDFQRKLYEIHLYYSNKLLTI